MKQCVKEGYEALADTMCHKVTVRLTNLWVL